MKAPGRPLIIELDTLLIVNRNLGCRKFVLKSRKGAASQKKLGNTDLDVQKRMTLEKVLYSAKNVNTAFCC